MRKPIPTTLPMCSWAGKTTYRAMAAEIDLCARALKATGVRPGDRITMAMPNCPQAVIMFYAINLVGATANDPSPFQREGNRVLT